MMSNARLYTAFVQYAQCFKAYKAEVKKYAKNTKEHNETLRDLLIRMNHAKAIIMLAQYEEQAC